jgi:hypothetical protein
VEASLCRKDCRAGGGDAVMMALEKRTSPALIPDEHPPVGRLSMAIQDAPTPRAMSVREGVGRVPGSGRHVTLAGDHGDPCRVQEGGH